MTDLQARIAGVLEEHRHKPPRVQARLVAELVEKLDQPPVIDAVATQRPDPLPADDSRPSQAFDEFVDRVKADPLRRLVDQGIATTRNRTHAALRALGLDPTEVRAIVIEHDTIRVYRYDLPEWVGAAERPKDPPTVRLRRSLPQTMPIIDAKESA